MLDYTIDIALFALATVGYLGTLTFFLFQSGLLLTSPFYGLTAIVLILLLLALNVVGIKYSSRFNEAVIAVDLVTVGLFLVFVLPAIISSGAPFRWFPNVVSPFQTGD